jgi:hypothetical protein
MISTTYFHYPLHNSFSKISISFTIHMSNCYATYVLSLDCNAYVKSTILDTCFQCSVTFEHKWFLVL